MPGRREQEFQGLTSEQRAHYERRVLPGRLLGAWANARRVRQRAMDEFEQIASLPLDAEQAKRCANQVAKLRRDLEDVESKLREAAGE